MTHDRPGAAPELEPKFEIEFNVRSPLARPIPQPMIVNDPVTPLLSAGQLDGDAPLVQGQVKAETLALHWAYFAYYEAHILTSGILKLRRIADSGRGWRENRADQYLVLMAVTTGMVSKIQLFMAGSADEDWDAFGKRMAHFAVYRNPCSGSLHSSRCLHS